MLWRPAGHISSLYLSRTRTPIPRTPCGATCRFAGAGAARRAGSGRRLLTPGQRRGVVACHGRAGGWVAGRTRSRTGGPTPIAPITATPGIPSSEETQKNRTKRNKGDLGSDRGPRTVYRGRSVTAPRGRKEDEREERRIKERKALVKMAMRGVPEGESAADESSDDIMFLLINQGSGVS